MKKLSYILIIFSLFGCVNNSLIENPTVPVNLISQEKMADIILSLSWYAV